MTGNPALKLLRRSLDAVGRNAHFVKVSTGNEYNAGDWDQNIDRSNRAEIDQPDFNETAVTVGKFDIYPVRTFATSFLTDHADCVVYVTEAVHSSDADIISAPDVERLKTAIERLKLPRRDLVRIEVRPSEGGYNAASALSDGGVEKALGFGSLCLVIRPVPVPGQR